MKRLWWMRGIKFAVLFAAAVALAAFVVMSLWNALVPVLFSGPALHFGQALGILVLTRILFGRLGGGSGHRMGWRGGMGKHWQQMTDEERQKFRERFSDRCVPGRDEVTQPKL